MVALPLFHFSLSISPACNTRTILCQARAHTKNSHHLQVPCIVHRYLALQHTILPTHLIESHYIDDHLIWKGPCVEMVVDNRAFTFPPLYDKLPVIALNSPLQILPVIIKYTTGRDVRIPVGQIYSPGCRKYVFCKSACQLLNVSIAMSFPCVCVGL
jgi:hypothetical protein